MAKHNSNSVEVNTDKLRQKMELFQKITGKTCQEVLKQEARLLAVNLAYNTPPYGMGQDALKMGERAVMNDILKIFQPASPIKLRFETWKLSLREDVRKFMTDIDLKNSIVAAIDQGNRYRDRRTTSRKQKITKKSKAIGITELASLLKNTKTFKDNEVITDADASMLKASRNAYGRTRKYGKNMRIVYNSKSVENLISAKTANIGFTKAGWGHCALLINAKVSNSMRGIPAWVKRHVQNAPASVIDRSGNLAQPTITLTNKIPWADKAMGKTNYANALKIAKNKFRLHLEKVIRESIKAKSLASN